MAAVYREVPLNFSEVEGYLTTSREEIIREIFGSKKCYFYDTCSFRRHANLKNDEAGYILNHIKADDGIIVITGTVLMELASLSGTLNKEYVDFLRNINEHGVTAVLLYEEILFDVMSMCFAANSKVNEYLTWAVRMINGPISTITETLDEDRTLYKEVIEGNGGGNSTVYERFFKAVRSNKESGDNLGEEMIAICLHLLTHLPGEADGKYCFITDDKGAAGIVNTALTKTNRQYQGSKAYIMSTPKLVQVMNRNRFLVTLSFKPTKTR